MWNKIYIVGKVTGLPEQEVKDKFAQTAEKLRKTYPKSTVINPVELVGDTSMDWGQAMKICISEMIHCDLLWVLPDWKDSKGAMVEIRLAKDLGLAILYQ